ncbi:TolC family protein [Escherichia coli]|uniref:TolC family protein n=1 Tax=Escherichia coli TaxID=562 RepID=UPI001EFC96C7|nr:TolC family protein [Escherichia coli]MCG9429851.1 TolC family protein [Escherichia coli]
MKYLTFLIATLMTCNTYAGTKQPCLLENYFKQTESYKSSMLDNETKVLELERERLSFLPDISVSIGQLSTNKSSFKGVNKSSVSLGLSQSIYNGNRYNIFKDKIENDIEYNHLMIHDKRNRYLVDLYRSLIDYNYKSDLRQLYSSQFDKQKEQLEIYKAKLASGDIAKFEYDIAELRKKELKNQVDIINNEVSQTELYIKTNFNVPVEVIKKITGKEILSCKGAGTEYILDKSRALLRQNEDKNYALNMTSTKPNVSLSLYMRPPSNGTLNELTTKKTEFSAAVNLTLPLSAYFSVNNNKKDHAISIRRINDTYDEKHKLYIREKENIISKIKDLEGSIALTRKKIELKSKEVDYVMSRFREKKETILSYYRQLDEFEHEKIKLKQDEREYEYYKIYIAILD